MGFSCLVQHTLKGTPARDQTLARAFSCLVQRALEGTSACDHT